MSDEKATGTDITDRYAWLITRDLFADVGSDAAGTAGPEDAPDEWVELLRSGAGWRWRLWDDDGELMAEGRGYAEGDDVGGEAFCYGPLGDAGAIWGATRITWPGHPRWECG